MLGLPRSARPRNRVPRLDPVLQRDVQRLAVRFPGTAAMYVESLTTGSAAAWNARATFPGASTLKLAIAVTLLAGRRPARVRHVARPDDAGMLIASDNAAANRALVLLGGSSGGGHLVNAQMRAIGLERTEMYGGFVIGTSLEPTREPSARGVPLNVVSQPYWGIGKATTAQDLAQLHRVVWLASGGLGPLGRSRQGSTPQRRATCSTCSCTLSRTASSRGSHRGVLASSCFTKPAGSMPRAMTQVWSSGRAGSSSPR